MTEYRVGFGGRGWNGGAFVVNAETPKDAASAGLDQYGEQFPLGSGAIETVFVTWFDLDTVGKLQGGGCVFTVDGDALIEQTAIRDG